MITKEYRFWRYRIFAFSWLAYAGFYLCRKNFGIAMLLLNQDLGYTKDHFAILLFLYSLFYALGQFYNGFLSDRFGPRLIVSIGLSLSILANIFMGFSSGLLVFGILLCLNGTGQSTGWSGTVKNMAPWFRRKERGVVMSWWATCYVIGGLAATAFATYMATHPLLLRTSDLKDPAGLTIQLHNGKDPFSKYLREHFSLEAREMLSEYEEKGAVSESHIKVLVTELNAIIKGPWLYDEDRFADVTLSEGTQKNIENLSKNKLEHPTKSLHGKSLIRFNKALLQQAYPGKFQLGWRRIFWAPAAVLVLIALLFNRFTRNKPTDVGLSAIDENDDNEDNEQDCSDRKSPQGATPNAESSSKEMLPLVLKSPVIWLISIMYFFTKMGRYALLFWLPIYMVEHLGYSIKEAGNTSMLYDAVGFAGVITAGYVSDKLFNARRMPVGALGMWSLAIVCFFHPQLAAWGHLGNAIGISLIGFFTYGPDALMSGAAAIDAGSQKEAGLSAGIINGVGSLGQMISGFVVVFIASNLGWDSLFYFFAIIAFVSGCLLAVKWNWTPTSTKKQIV